MKNVLVVLAVMLISLAAANAIENQKSEPSYVGSETCQACHDEVYETWKSSKHAALFKPEQETSRKCYGCHSTGISREQQDTLDNFVGCEACHGPGEEHFSSGGEIKLVSSNSADVCGRCHNGNQSGEDIAWMMEYRPGMKLSDLKGLKLIPVSPEKTPPYFEDIHPAPVYNMWLSSGHSRTPARDIEVGGSKWEEPITCTACHNPHSSANPMQLVMEPKDLCKSCHSLQATVLKGFGAKGIEETRSLHTAAPCDACHMTEKNHLMKMLRPDDPTLAENRLDSCSACHEIKDREMRTGQLHDMEAWYKETMAPVQESLNIVEEKLKKNPRLLNTKLKTKLKDVKSNLSIVLSDGSNGVHNLDYMLEIMYLAKKDLKEIIEDID